MAKKTITSKTIIRLAGEYNGKELKIIADQDTNYIDISHRSFAEVNSWVIRTTEATIVSSDIPTPPASSSLAYTVADGTLFRLGEVVEVLDTDDDHLGFIVIMDITGNVVSGEFRFNTSFTVTAGDKLVLKVDSELREEGILTINPANFRYIYMSGSGTIDIQPLNENGLMGKF